MRLDDLPRAVLRVRSRRVRSDASEGSLRRWGLPRETHAEEAFITCARTGCGQRFAHAQHPASRGAQEPAYCYVPPAVFLPGWVLSREGDGTPVWSMSHRAWRRNSQGRAPTLRRPPVGIRVLSRHPSLDPVAVADPENGGVEPDVERVATFAGVRERGAWSLPQYFPLPVLIVCPACGLRQVLDAGVLGIA